MLRCFHHIQAEFKQRFGEELFLLVAYVLNLTAFLLSQLPEHLKFPDRNSARN